jgi:anthocyanidin reductase
MLKMFAALISDTLFPCSDDDEQLLERPRVIMSSEKLVREGFQYRHNTLDEIYDNVVEYGKALGILPY